jgi:hypothetical protein
MATTRFQNGVTNARSSSTLGAMGQPDPTKFTTFFEDFNTFTASDWNTNTVELGAGTASRAITSAAGNADGGILLITNDDADNDSMFLNKIGESFKFEAGKQLWFKARFKISDATQSDFVMGLQITDSTPLDVTHGVYFMKDDNDAFLDFYVEKSNVQSSAIAVYTVVSNTYMTVGFYYNGVNEVGYYVNDVRLGSLPVTNLPDDEELTISFGIQNGDAVIRTMSVDYVFASKER